MRIFLFILLFVATFQLLAQKTNASVPEPLYLSNQISSKITAHPLFTLSTDGCMVIAGLASKKEASHPLVMKIDPKGKLLWEVAFDKKYQPTAIAAGLDGGLVLAVSSNAYLKKGIDSKIFFIDKNGKEKAQWGEIGKSLVVAKIFGLQSNEKGEVVFLFESYNGETQKRRPFACAAYLDTQGKEKWMLEPEKSISLFGASFSKEGVGLCGVRIRSANVSPTVPPTLCAGWTIDSSRPPQLQNLEPYKMFPRAFIGAFEKNGLFYIGSGYKQQQLKSIDFVDKRGPQIKTLLEEPIYQAEGYGGCYANPCISYMPQINLQLTSLPERKIAVLDGSSSARVRCLDEKGRIFNEYEIHGKGEVHGSALFYEKKTHTLHIFGRTIQNPQNPDLYVKRRDNSLKTVFWSQVHFE